MSSRTFKTVTYRAMSVLLSVITLFSVFDFSIFTTTAAATDGGFEISLKWNGTDQDPEEFVYESDGDEIRLVRLKVSYQNKEVSSGYAPGEIVITVPGIKDAVRSGTSYYAAAVAADKASSTDKTHNWSYTYNSKSDTFAFTNNNRIEANSTFEGSFEIIWSLPSRDTKNDFSTEIQAQLKTSKNEQASSNKISYSQTREGDKYTLSAETSSLTTAEGLTSKLPQGTSVNNYIWVKYDINGTDTYYARNVQDSERFDCYFLPDAVVQGAGLEDTGETKEIDGVIYKRWSVEKDITPNDILYYLENVYVAYPEDKYDEQEISAHVYLMGTYYEDDEETSLAHIQIKTNLSEFGFKSLDGDLYKVDKYSYGVTSTYIDRHCDACHNYGAVNSLHLNGSTEYYSRFSLRFNYRDITGEDSYDFELVDDIMDVLTTDGDLRQLEDDEYDFTRVVIPSANEISNANGFSIEPDKYAVEIYVRHDGDEPTEFTKIDGSYHITADEQSIELPSGTAGVQVKIINVQESISASAPLNIKVYYTFNIDDPDVVVDGGNIINYMYIKIYDENKNWINSGYGKDTYPTGGYTYLYDRDIDLYGESFDREMATLHIVEVPNNYTSKTTIKKTSESEEAYYFTGTIEDSFTIPEGNYLKNFSTYTILPEGMKLQPLYDDEEALLEYLTFSSNNYSDWYIKENVTLEIKENYKDTGRTYIAIHYKFNDPITASTNISVSNIPMYYEIDKTTVVSMVFKFTSMTLIDDTEGKWYATSTDNISAENKIWQDIDGDQNTSETAAYSYSSVEVITPQYTELQFTKSVRTNLTNGYVQPSENSETPCIYKNTEYSYKLRLQTSQGSAGNIVFVDTLETGPNAQWQGTFVKVDTSYAESLGFEPTVYYSSKPYYTVKGEDSPSKPDLKSSDDWTTNRDELTEVKSIAVDCGDKTMSSGSSLYIEIYMQSPDDSSFENKTTENFGYVYYDSYNANGNVSEQDRDLSSNYVSVSIIPIVGTIKIVKSDEVSGERLSGAVFSLYEMLGTEPNTNTDKLIAEDLTTNDGGIASIKVPYGNYYVVETTAPIGYKLDSNLYKITVDEPKVFTVNIKNERNKGKFTLTKVSDRNSSAYLQGATFTLYSNNGTEIQTDLTTDASGKLKVSDLEWGDYYLKETQAPSGYLISDEKISFTINAENIEVAVTVKNEQMPASVNLVKTEVLEDGTTTTGEPVDGAMYKLYDSSDSLLGTYMTDKNGEIYVDDLTFGDYYFQESIAAQGYELNTDKITFTINGNSPQSDNTVSVTIPTTDTRKAGSVWLQKTDDAGEYVQNAVFALYNSSGEQVNEQGVKDTTKTFTTSAEGIIEITGLYWGDYYLEEIKAPTGYELSKTKYDVKVDRTTVNQTKTIYATNNRKTGSVELTKVSEGDNTTTLSGAVYTLYKSDGTVYHDELKTDANGIIKVENIEWGSYYFLEKTPPEGYGLSDEKIRFSVNYLTAGKVQKLTAADSITTGQIEVVKRIKISDIVYAHGNPTFIFKLDGTDVDGKTYTYYKNVVFNEKFLDLYKEAHGETEYVEQSVVFTDVPVGTWTVSEVDTVCYEFDKIENIQNGMQKGNTVEFTLNSENIDGKATFTNKKITQTATTHTSLAVNITKVSRKLTAIVASWKGEETITSETLDRKMLDVYAVYDDGEQVKLDDDAYTLDPETFNQAMNGEYTVKIEYTEGGRTCTDTFELSLNLPPTFTWTVNDGEITVDGVTYDGTATITGYTGSSTVMNIPSKVTGINTLNSDGTATYSNNGKTYLVVATGNTSGGALSGISAIQKVIIPATVRKIGYASFVNCSSLKEIEIAEISALLEIGGYAFHRTGLTGDLIIPNGVTTIGEYAFDYTSISTLEIPNTVTEIGQYAFLQTSITALEIPNSVKTVGEYAFSDCYYLKDLTFEENSQLEAISKGMFCKSVALSGNLIIPKSVKIIGDNAFEIKEESFPDKLTPSVCLSFEEGSQLEEIGKDAFRNCTHLTGSLTIPASVQTIGERAFLIPLKFNLEQRVSFAIESGSNLTSIGEQAFYNCQHFTGSLTIPEGVTTIKKETFYNCISLSGTLTIPASVTTIEEAAFMIPSYEVAQTLSPKLQLTFAPNSQLTTIGKQAFYYCTHLTGSLTIPASVTTIGNEAFMIYYYTNLTPSVQFAFEDGSQLTTIGKKAFYNCQHFTGNLVIPAGVTSIEDETFYQCKNLTGTLTIHKDITTIGAFAFYNCVNLTALNFESNSQLTTIAKYAFNSCSGFKGDLTIPDTVTSIGQYSFTNCSGFDGTLTIPSSVTSIEAATFSGCSSLSGNLNIPNTITSIGKSAFTNCFKLTGLVIPAEVTSIGENAFSGCGEITTLTFAEGSKLTTIGSTAFKNCKGLKDKEVTIPEKVTSIGENAFVGTNIAVLSVPSTIDLTNSPYGLTNDQIVPYDPTA